MFYLWKGTVGESQHCELRLTERLQVRKLRTQFGMIRAQVGRLVLCVQELERPAVDTLLDRARAVLRKRVGLRFVSVLMHTQARG